MKWHKLIPNFIQQYMISKCLRPYGYDISDRSTGTRYSQNNENLVIRTYFVSDKIRYSFATGNPPPDWKGGTIELESKAGGDAKIDAMLELGIVSDRNLFMALADKAGKRLCR